MPLPGHGFGSSILRYLCPSQKIPLLKFQMTSLHVICGLPPQIKNPGYAYVFDPVSVCLITAKIFGVNRTKFLKLKKTLCFNVEAKVMS